MSSGSNNFELTVTTPTGCNDGNLMMLYGTRRVLFNCGEGTQRLNGENKVRITKVEDVFVTELKVDTLGGLGGMLLTLADVETARLESSKSTTSSDFSIRVTGPPGIARFVHALRFVYKRPSSTITVVEIDDEPENVMSPDGLVVKPVLLLPVKAEEHESKRAKPSGFDYSVPRNFGKLNVQSSSCPSLDAAVGYVVSVPARRGKFLPTKAMELGVPRGPCFKQLTQGESVTTPSGRVVKSEECMEQGEVGQSVVVFSCPTLSHLQNLTENDPFKDKIPAEGLQFMFHFTPVCVLEDSRYWDWVGKVSAGTNVFVDKKLCVRQRAFWSSAVLQDELSRAVDPEIFPPDQSDAADIEKVKPEKVLSLIKSHPNSSIPEMLSRFVVHPASSRGLVPPKPPTITRTGSTTRSLVQAQKPRHEGLFELTFLGTGSALPSKYRNVSAILLRFGNGKAMLMDSGEGTFGQMVRRFGPSLTRSIINDQLSLVWISHLHADHHLGLLQILVNRKHAEVPLTIVGPGVVGEMLSDFVEAIPALSASSYTYITLTRSKTEPHTIDQQTLPCLGVMGIEKLVSVPVIHCFNSFGLVVHLSNQEKTKLVYSGDTEPCEALVKYGEDALLLIHEATFEDAKVGEARGKRHSTVSEAVGVGNEMKADYTILTHFSQRYPKETPYIDSPPGPTKIIFASDLMSISDCTLAKASELETKTRAILENYSTD